MREKKKRSDEDESFSNMCHLTYGLTRTHALTHIHTEQVKLTVIYQSVKFSFIDPVKGVGFINYSNAALWLGVAAATQTFSDVISLYFFSLLPAGCGWTQCRSLIALLFFCGSPHTQPRTHTKIPPEGKTLVFYLWMWAARGEKPVPRSTVSEAGNGEASLTSINLLSFHPSALHLSLSSSFSAPLFGPARFFLLLFFQRLTSPAHVVKPLWLKC